MTTHTRKLVKTSAYSYALVIPKEIVEKYGWKERQRMTITDRGHGEVVIKDAKRR